MQNTSDSTSTNDSTAVLAEKVQPIPVSQPGLTAFEESAHMTQQTTTAPLAIERVIAQPYAVAPPTELLKRNFLVASFLWTAALGPQVVKFPGVFSTITSITDVMKKFWYWRGSIHVEIRMNSTPYHQGSLLVGWLPCVSTTNTNSVPRTNQAVSTYNSLVLSASTQDSCSFDIPWCHPNDWLVWDTEATNQDHSSVFINVLNVLVSSSPGIAVSVPILVYASFKDIEITGLVSQMRKGSKFDENPEAKNKQSAGIDAKGVVSTVSKIARQMPVIGGVWSGIADKINSLAGDLSKPQNMSATTYVVNRYYGDINHGAGLDDVAAMSVYPNPQVTSAPTMYGMQTSHLKVTQLAQRPALYDQITWNAVTTSLTIECEPNVRGATIATNDWLYSMNRCFKFWRGSIKYLFHFCVPAFYSFRVRISVYINHTVGNYGDVMSRIIDVKGDTWEGVTIPYLHTTTWCDVDEGMAEQRVRIELLTPIIGSSDPGAPIVYVNVFRAAGEDFQFSGYRNPSDYTLKNQMNIGSKFAEVFPGINEGTKQSITNGNVMCEVIDTVSDLLKKPGEFTPAGGPYFPGSGTALFSPFQYFSRFFMFWRGGRVLRHYHPPNVTGSQGGWHLAIGSTHFLENGWVPAYSTATGPYQQEGVLVPYFCAQPYYPTQAFDGHVVNSAYSQYPVDAVLTITTADKVTISGADDICYLFPVLWGNVDPAVEVPEPTSTSTKAFALKS